MTWRTWRELGISQSSTAGAAVDLDSFPLPTRNPYHIIEGFTNYSSPTALLGSTFVEGVDFPFFTRDFTVRDTRPPFNSEALRRALDKVIQGSNFFLGLPSTIFSAPPDPQPITMGRVLDTPNDIWIKRRLERWKAASRATSDAPGYWGELIPAGAYTDISCRVMSEIQRHFLEGIVDNGLTWSLWTQTEVLGFFNQRLALFLVETGMILNRTTIAVSAGATSIDLSQDLLEIKRVGWNNTGLVRIDPWALDSGVVGWQSSSGVPYAYVEEPLDPLTMKLIPTPSVNGTVDLIYIQVPTAVTSACLPLPFPDFVTPYIKYGVMADMLAKEGEANDPERSAYCQSRFAEGIEMVKMFMGSK